MLHPSLGKGETHTAVRSDKKLLALAYKDRKVVNLLTNVACEKSVTTRKGKLKPEAVQNYSLHMNALDRFDRQHTLYLMRHRKRKWTRAYMYSMVKFAIHNARLLWNFSHQPKESYTLFEFICELIDGLAPLQRFVENVFFLKISNFFLHSVREVFLSCSLSFVYVFFIYFF